MGYCKCGKYVVGWKHPDENKGCVQEKKWKQLTDDDDVYSTFFLRPIPCSRTADHRSKRRPGISDSPVNFLNLIC